MSKHPEGVTACPLSWPEGWKRTLPHLRKTDHPFTSQYTPIPTGPDMYRPHGRKITFDRARKLLAEELGRMNATAVILSTNLPLRVDGEPHAGAAGRRIDEPGVAVYFFWKGKPMVMARDAYADIAANIRSLTLAIKAIRDLERHGGSSMMERAFSGFTSLPPPAGSKPKRPWWDVMRYSADPAERDLLSAGEVRARYTTLAQRLHPDKGGSHEAMSELNQARDDALAELGSVADA